MDSDFSIYPVSAASAVQWLQGNIGDADLERSPAQVVFLNELGNRASYRKCLAQILRLYDCGCQAGIAHSCSDLMTGHLIRLGGIPVYKEWIFWRGKSLSAVRIACQPNAFGPWVKKLRGVK